MSKPMRGLFWGLVRDFERLLLQAALDAHDGNLSRAAEAMQIHRIVFVHKADALGLRRNRRMGRPRTRRDPRPPPTRG